MLQTFDAELFFGGRDGRLVGASEHDERREIGARRQIFRKLEAGARRGSIGIDGIVEYAEAVLVAQPLVLAAHIGGLANVERKPQRIERRPPQLPLAHDVAEERQAVGFLIAVGGTLIGDVGRGRGALEQRRALLIVDRADLHDGARHAQPSGGVVGLCGDDLAEQRHAGAEIVLGKG